jgi:flagellar biosynthesis/type III secretory pathway protein FliH
MGVIRASSAVDIAKDAVVLNLGDLARQGEAIIAAARKRAETIVREAQAERDRLIANAAAEGREQGLKQGTADGQAKGEKQGRDAALKERTAALAALEKSWTDTLATWDATRDALAAEARQGVVKLAVEIAQRIVKRHIEATPDAAVAQVEAALAAVARPSELTVSIHPRDRDVVQAALPGLTKRFSAGRSIELIDDESVGRGGCVLRCRGALGGEIDATIDTQAERIAQALGVARSRANASAAAATPTAGAPEAAAPPAPPAPPLAPPRAEPAP